MNSTTGLDLFTGWSTGFAFAQANNREREVKQGKNFYLSIPFIANQFAQYGSVLSQAADYIPHKFVKLSVKVFANFASIASLPVFLFFAAVKHDHYEGAASFGNEALKERFVGKFLSLPEKLGTRSIKVINFLSNNTGTLLTVATVVTSLALIHLGAPYVGGAVLVALSYNSIDQMGFVPKKISLFIETYMPTVATIGIIIGGTWVSSIVASLSLLTFLSPSISQFLYRKVDLLYRNYFKMSSVSLEELNKPLQLKTLNFNEINTILEANECDFSLNPSHCVKTVADNTSLSENENFENINLLFNKVDWTKEYNVLKLRLMDDEIFRSFIANESLKDSVVLSAQEINERFDSIIEKLAIKQKISKEKYLANYLKSQMTTLVKILNGEERVKGTQQDLADAITSMAKINGGLNFLQKNDPISFQDTLMKIAVEGGDYCARGIKRMADELIFSLRQGENNKDCDPVTDYIQKVESSLQMKRLTIIENYYAFMAEDLGIPEVISGDVHGFDLYRLYFSLGFYPLTQQEKNSIGLVETVTWELFEDCRKEMYEDYKSSLGDVIHEVGEVHFGAYIQQLIQTNSKLSERQKVILSERFTMVSDESMWNEMPYEKVLEKFRNLMLVTLGVLKMPSTSS